MTRYYCSGFDVDNAFGHGLGDMFKAELKNIRSIVYIPGGPEKVEKAKTKLVPLFDKYFRNAGIEFEKSIIISPELKPEIAQEYVANANFVMLMGGNPFSQKEMCVQLGLMDVLKKCTAVILGYSAGAMLMSKYIIVTPCSEEFPEFRIEEGLNLDGISIYPHNNTDLDNYPDTLVVDDETYQRNDLIRVAKEYGEFYLIQDYENNNDEFDISYIKCKDGNLEYHRENAGKIWLAGNNCVKII